MVLALLILLAAGGFGFYIYTQVVKMLGTINSNKKQLDDFLGKRQKLYDSLLEVSKKYPESQQTPLKEIPSLKTRIEQATTTGDDKTRFLVEEEISKISNNLYVSTFESCTSLKKDDQALALQGEIAAIERELIVSKRAYNESIEKYEVAKKSLVSSLLISFFSNKLLKNFVGWGTTSTTSSK